MYVRHLRIAFPAYAVLAIVLVLIWMVARRTERFLTFFFYLEITNGAR